MSKYPTLRLAALNQLAEVKNQMAADANFLDKEECPYDPETKELLTKLLKAETVEVAVEKIVRESGPGRGRPSKDIKLSEEDQQAILDGIKKTMAELDDMSKNDLETNERIQIAKTRTQLMDQLLKMQERHYSITRTQEFIETIVGIATDLIGEADREVLMSRLEKYR